MDTGINTDQLRRPPEMVEGESQFSKDGNSPEHNPDRPVLYQIYG